MALLPKCEDEEDTEEGAARPSVEIRPLPMKNTCSKSVAGVAGQLFRKAICAGAHVAQRGFVPRRDLMRNILEVDAFARMFGLAVPLGHMPLFLFLDIEAAFLSVSRIFLRAALLHSGFPPGARRLIEALCEDNKMFWVAHKPRLVAVARSGVAQGCPISSAMFVVFVDPILRLLHNGLHGPKAGITRLCVGDMAILLRGARFLEMLRPMFDHLAAMG